LIHFYKRLYTAKSDINEQFNWLSICLFQW